MAWRTLYVASNESGIPESLDTETVSTERPHTGLYHTGGTSPLTAIEYYLSSYVSLKAGYWRNVERTASSTDFFKFYNIDKTVQRGTIILRDTFNTISIEGVVGLPNAKISAYSTPLLRMHNRWVHVGMFMRPGKTSFYINGKQYLTCDDDLAYEVTGDTLVILRNSGIGNYRDFIDDILVQVSDENEVDESPPGYRYYPRRVTNSTVREWTEHSPNVIQDQQVFEVPNDGDVSYIESDTSEERQLYRIQNVPFQVPFGYVSKTTTVQSIARHNGSGNLKYIITDGVNEIESPTILLGDDYSFSQYTADLAPDGSELDNNKVNQLEYGVESEDII